MGFYFRVAPGVRVRLTGSGLRTSIGPRMARVHVGAGGAGVSTGTGPFSYYKSLPHSQASRSTSGGSRTVSAATPAAQQKADEGKRLGDEITSIVELNHVDFPAAQRPVAPPPNPVDIATFRAARRREAKKRTSVFKLKERQAALQEAERLAQADLAAASAAAQADKDKRQGELDAWWARMEGCDPETVLAYLAVAFEDNHVPAAAVGVDGTEVSLLVVVPGPDTLPDRKPTVTAAGNLSLKRLTKTETSDLYKALVCGHTLLAVREGLAVAPALTSARVVTIRHSAPDVYGKSGPEVLLAAAFTRSALDGVQWLQASAVDVTHECSTELTLNEKGVTKELQRIDLHDEPHMAAILESVDVDELLAES